MKKLLKNLALTLLAGSLMLTACKKEEEAVEPDTKTASQTSETDAVVNEVVSITQDVMENEGAGFAGGRTENCLNINANPLSRSLVLDFGAGCRGLGNRLRKGKINIVYTGDRKNATQQTVTFDNFGTENYTVSGTLTFSGITRNTLTSISYTISSTNLVITFSNGRKLTITSMQRTHVFDYKGTPRDPKDDEVRISGAVTGMNAESESFTHTITEPYVFKMSCFINGICYPASGKATIKVQNKPEITLNFGTGACDKTVEVTINGKLVTLTLP